MGAIRLLASCATCGIASRATISPEAYQPLSTLETKEQFVKSGAALGSQSGCPGLLSTDPFEVSYHWYRKPSYLLRCETSVRVARISAAACGVLISPRSRAETTAQRYTPMLAAEVYRP